MTEYNIHDSSKIRRYALEWRNLDKLFISGNLAYDEQVESIQYKFNFSLKNELKHKCDKFNKIIGFRYTLEYKKLTRSIDFELNNNKGNYVEIFKNGYDCFKKLEKLMCEYEIYEICLFVSFDIFSFLYRLNNEIYLKEFEEKQFEYEKKEHIKALEELIKNENI